MGTSLGVSARSLSSSRRRVVELKLYAHALKLSPNSQQCQADSFQDVPATLTRSQIHLQVKYNEPQHLPNLDILVGDMNSKSTCTSKNFGSLSSIGTSATLWAGLHPLVGSESPSRME